MPPAIFNAGEKIAISVYENTLKTAAFSSTNAKIAYAVSTVKAGEAYDVASAKGKELVVYSSIQAKKIYSVSTVKAKEAAALTARVSAKAAADLQAFLITFSKFLAVQANNSATMAKAALSYTSVKAGEAYSVASVKGKELATYSYAQSKIAASFTSVKLIQLYSFSSVQAKQALTYSLAVSKKTAADLQSFLLYFSKLIMAQVDRSATLAGKTASTFASFAALEGSKLYSQGMLFLKVKTV